MKKIGIFAALVAALLNVSTHDAPAPASAVSGVATTAREMVQVVT